MAKLILKVNYYKPGQSKSMGGYAKYIATRENVEKPNDVTLRMDMTEKQAEIIEKLKKDFPISLHSEEYLAYLSSPTRENASEYITRTLEDNLPHIVDSPTYADYIATRPRAERFGSHGLFSSGDEPVVLSKVSKELNEHQGNVWVFIASVKREDAERLGFDHATRWKDMLGSQVTQMASALNIPVEHLRWYAAFHNEGHHPHAHIMVWSSEPSEGFINNYGIQKLRSSFAKDIFAQDLQSAYEDQTEIRRQLKETVDEMIREILARADEQNFENESIEQKLPALSERLKKTKGKKIYGYLSRDIKDMVDDIVDELAKDETIAELYDLWYEKKYEILGTYSSKRPPKVPLSENEEFKSIRNAVIREALRMSRSNEQTQEEKSDNGKGKHKDGTSDAKKKIYPNTNSRVSAVAVTRLFKNACGIFRDRLDDENRRTIYTNAVDKRIRREDEAKRNAELIYD